MAMTFEHAHDLPCSVRCMPCYVLLSVSLGHLAEWSMAELLPFAPFGMPPLQAAHFSCSEKAKPNGAMAGLVEV